MRRDLMILVYGRADSVETIGCSAVSRTAMKLRPGDHRFWRPHELRRCLQGRDHSASRASCCEMSKRPPLRVIEQYLTFLSVLCLLGESLLCVILSLRYVGTGIRTHPTKPLIAGRSPVEYSRKDARPRGEALRADRACQRIASPTAHRWPSLPPRCSAF
jgi:hypothetical protein